jgi:hypothetical protein
MMTVVDDVLVEEKEYTQKKILNVKTFDVLAGLFTQNKFSSRAYFD